MEKERKQNKVLIEKYKGHEIYYDKDKERFVADKPKLDIHFEARSIWEIKGHIKETGTKEVNKKGMIKTGIFGNSIAKIHVLTENKNNKRTKYKILEDTEESYDTGNIKENDDTKIYPQTEHNQNVYDNVKKLEQEKNLIESKQTKLIEKLSMEEPNKQEPQKNAKN